MLGRFFGIPEKDKNSITFVMKSFAEEIDKITQAYHEAKSSQPGIEIQPFEFYDLYFRILIASDEEPPKGIPQAKYREKRNLFQQFYTAEETINDLIESRGALSFLAEHPNFLFQLSSEKTARLFLKLSEENAKETKFQSKTKILEQLIQNPFCNNALYAQENKLIIKLANPETIFKLYLRYLPPWTANPVFFDILKKMMTQNIMKLQGDELKQASIAFGKLGDTPIHKTIFAECSIVGLTRLIQPARVQHEEHKAAPQAMPYIPSPTVELSDSSAASERTALPPITPIAEAKKQTFNASVQTPDEFFAQPAPVAPPPPAAAVPLAPAAPLAPEAPMAPLAPGAPAAPPPPPSFSPPPTVRIKIKTGKKDAPPAGEASANAESKEKEKAPDMMADLNKKLAERRKQATGDTHPGQAATAPPALTRRFTLPKLNKTKTQADAEAQHDAKEKEAEEEFEKEASTPLQIKSAATSQAAPAVVAATGKSKVPVQDKAPKSAAAAPVPAAAAPGTAASLRKANTSEKNKAPTEPPKAVPFGQHMLRKTK